MVNFYALDPILRQSIALLYSIFAAMLRTDKRRCQQYAANPEEVSLRKKTKWVLWNRKTLGKYCLLIWGEMFPENTTFTKISWEKEAIRRVTAKIEAGMMIIIFLRWQMFRLFEGIEAFLWAYRLARKGEVLRWNRLVLRCWLWYSRPNIFTPFISYFLISKLRSANIKLTNR